MHKKIINIYNIVKYIADLNFSFVKLFIDIRASYKSSISSKLSLLSRLIPSRSQKIHSVRMLFFLGVFFFSISKVKRRLNKPKKDSQILSLSVSSRVWKDPECIPLEYRVPCKMWYFRTSEETTTLFAKCLYHKSKKKRVGQQRTKTSGL